MQSNPDTRTEDLLKDLSADYANYLIVDSSSEVWKNNHIVRSWGVDLPPIICSWLISLFFVPSIFWLQWLKLETVIRNLSSNVEEFSSLLESVSLLL